MRLSNWDQRQLDIESGKQLDTALSEDRVVAEPVQPFAWRYEIKYGPEGEANYAWVYDDKDQMVCTAKLHHALAIVKRTTPPDSAPSGEAVREALKTARGEFIRAGYDEESRIVKLLDAALTAPGASVGEMNCSPIEKLMEFVERTAKQKTTDEFEDHEREGADYEGAYDIMVMEARVVADAVNLKCCKPEVRHGACACPNGPVKEFTSGPTAPQDAKWTNGSNDKQTDIGSAQSAAGGAATSALTVGSGSPASHGCSNSAPQDAKADAGEELAKSLFEHDHARPWSDAKSHQRDHYLDQARYILGLSQFRTLPPSASKPVTVEEIAREIDRGIGVRDLFEGMQELTGIQKTARAILALINARTSGVE